MARKYGIEKYGPNRYHIVTAKMGFHGRTFGAMSATGQPGNGCQVGFGPMTYGFSYAPYNDLQAFKDACTENTIAIMVEPVQGEGGVHPATMEFMQGLRKFCDENDMLLLIDEVQTGWCRTGAVMSYMNLWYQTGYRINGKGSGRWNANRCHLCNSRGCKSFHSRFPWNYIRRTSGKLCSCTG